MEHCFKLYFFEIMRKIGILLLILLLPSIVYLILFSSESVYRPLPYFGPRHASEVGTTDTIYHVVPSFTLIGSNNDPVPFSSFSEKVKLVYFFHPDTEFEVPLTANLREKVQRPLLEHNKGKMELLNKNIDIIGICVKQDWNKEEMQGYSMGFKRAPFWTLYRINMKESAQAVEAGFCVEEIPFDKLEKEGLPLYYLLDKENHIRGIFNARSVKDTEHLQDAIAMLISEEMVPLKRDNQ